MHCLQQNPSGQYGSNVNNWNAIIGNLQVSECRMSGNWLLTVSRSVWEPIGMSGMWDSADPTITVLRHMQTVPHSTFEMGNQLRSLVAHIVFTLNCCSSVFFGYDWNRHSLTLLWSFSGFFMNFPRNSSDLPRHLCNANKRRNCAKCQSDIDTLSNRADTSKMVFNLW